MSKTVYSDGAYITLVEKSDVTLVPDTLVAFHTDGTAKAATAGVVLGVFTQRLTTGAKDVAIRLLGKGGTVRVVQTEQIAMGAAVMQDPAAPTKVKTFAAGGVFLGFKKGPNAGAANDVIELADVPGFVPGGADVVKQTLAALSNVNGAIAALTSSSTTTQAEFNALRDATETLADDVRAIDAALRAAGIYSV